MPVISRFKTQNSIDPRVQAAPTPNAGGEVARALGGIGRDTEVFATKILKKRKDHQTSTFRQDQIAAMDLERQELFRDLSNSMNPADGNVNLKGSAYDGIQIDEAMAGWETSRAGEIADTAPTNDARRAFELASGARASVSNLYTELKVEGISKKEASPLIGERINIQNLEEV